MSAGGMGGQGQPMGGGKGGMGMQGPASGGKGGMGVNRGPGGNAQNNPGGYYGGPRPFGPGSFMPGAGQTPMPRPMPVSHQQPMTFAPPSPRKPVPMGGLLSNLFGNFGG